MLTPEERQLLEEFNYFLHPLFWLMMDECRMFIEHEWGERYKDDAGALKRFEQTLEAIKREGGMEKLESELNWKWI